MCVKFLAQGNNNNTKLVGIAKPQTWNLATWLYDASHTTYTTHDTQLMTQLNRTTLRVRPTSLPCLGELLPS